MSIIKRNKSWWVDVGYNRRRYRRRSPVNTRAGALAYEAVVRDRLLRGEPIDVQTVEVPTFAVFCEEWFTKYVTPNYKPSVRVATRCHLDVHLKPFFGRLRIDQIGAMHLEEFKAKKCAEHLAPKSVNNQLGTLSRCLRIAMDWGYIKEMPRPTRLKVPPSQPFFYLPHQSERLIEAMSDSVFKAMSLAAFRTGMRYGELTGLQWNAVNLAACVITVSQSCVDGIIGSPKNNRIRHIPIAQDLLETLTAMVRSDGFVFSYDGKTPLTRWQGIQAMHKACDRAGFKRRGWHVCRHSFASQLAMAGVLIPVIQKLMGHADIRMTMAYAHLAPTPWKDVVDVLVHLPHESNGTIAATQKVISDSTKTRAS